MYSCVVDGKKSVEWYFHVLAFFCRSDENEEISNKFYSDNVNNSNKFDWKKTNKD